MGLKSIILEAEDGIDIVENTRRHLKSVGLKEGRLADNSPVGSPNLYFFGKSTDTGAKVKILAYCLPTGVELSEEQHLCIKHNRDEMFITFREKASDLDIEMTIREMVFSQRQGTETKSEGRGARKRG